MKIETIIKTRNVVKQWLSDKEANIAKLSETNYTQLVVSTTIPVEYIASVGGPLEFVMVNRINNMYHIYHTIGGQDSKSVEKGSEASRFIINHITNNIDRLSQITITNNTKITYLVIVDEDEEVY